MASKQTAPHDYRLLSPLFPKLTVVGGQAVNLWAIVYCDESDKLPSYGSYDLDVIARGAVAKALKNLPNWNYNKTPMWSMDIREATLTAKSDDGRLLVVEVLKRVNGLDEDDLKATRIIKQGGVQFRVLDPIAMLKSKAANVRMLKQDENPPRQDREHLKIIAICFPRFLRDAHDQAMRKRSHHAAMAKLISRAFRTLADKKIANTLLKNGIGPRALMPELQDSPIEKVRVAYHHQLPRLKTLEAAV